MIKELKKQSKEAVSGNFLKIIGLYYLSILPLFLFELINNSISEGIFNYIENMCEALIASDLEFLVMLLEICMFNLIVGIIGSIMLFIFAQFVQMYGVMHVNTHKEFPNYKDVMKASSKNFIKKCLVITIVGFMIVTGLMLFIFPGVMIAIALSFIGFMLLDEEYKGYSIKNLIKEGFRLTNGYQVKILMLYLSLLPLIIGCGVLELFLMKNTAGAIIMNFIRAIVLFYIMSTKYNMYVNIKEENRIPESKEEDAIEDNAEVAVENE